MTVARCLTMTAAVALLVSCAESTATATVDPDDWTGGRTIDAALVRDAEAVMADAPESEPGWSIGVVLAENADGWGSDWAVMTADDVVVLSLASNCDDDGDTVPESDLVLVLDPGDLIGWSNAGDDQVVCSGEVHMLIKAAA